MSEMKEIINGYIGDDSERADNVMTYIKNMKATVKGYVSKIAIGGAVFVILGLLMTTYFTSALVGLMYVGFMALGVALGVFVCNWLFMSSIQKPATVRQEAIEFILDNGRKNGENDTKSRGETLKNEAPEEEPVQEIAEESEPIEETPEEPEETAEEQEAEATEEEEDDDEDMESYNIERGPIGKSATELLE